MRIVFDDRDNLVEEPTIINTMTKSTTSIFSRKGQVQMKIPEELGQLTKSYPFNAISTLVYLVWDDFKMREECNVFAFIFVAKGQRNQ